MNVRWPRLPDLLSLCAPVPALLLGVHAMRQLGVRTSVWSANLAAGAVGVLVFAAIRSGGGRTNPRAWYWAAAGGMTALLLTFASDGLDGVHRWVYLGSLGLHVSAIVAPVTIACVAAVPDRHAAIAIAAAAAIILALQPDAAQATSFAAACAVVFVRDPRLEPRARVGGLVTLAACAIVSLVRADPLKPVRHVEGIFEVVSARGAAWALLAAVTLLLLPLPYVFAWARRRQTLAPALGVHVALVTIAPAWGTFPVPVMGYGVSPILGYFIALALCAGSTSLERPFSPTPPSSSA